MGSVVGGGACVCVYGGVVSGGGSVSAGGSTGSGGGFEQPYLATRQSLTAPMSHALHQDDVCHCVIRLSITHRALDVREIEHLQTKTLAYSPLRTPVQHGPRVARVVFSLRNTVRIL